MSTLNHYRVFIAIVETGSIQQAALHLNYSSPAVSKQLSRLEENLQVQLFHRSHKKLSISEAGKKFYPKCKDILSAVSQAEDELLEEQDALSGDLSITVSRALCRSSLFDVIAQFTQKHQKINFNIRFSDHLEDLHNDDIDFAFRLGKLQDHSHMSAIPLIQTELRACATPNYISSHGEPDRPSNLGTAKLIGMSTTARSKALRKFLKREKFDQHSAAMHICNDIEGVYQSVRAGLGIGFLLDVSVKRELEEGSFVSIWSDRNLPKKRLYLLFKTNHWHTQKHRAFISHIKNSCLKYR